MEREKRRGWTERTETERQPEKVGERRREREVGTHTQRRNGEGQLGNRMEQWGGGRERSRKRNGGGGRERDFRIEKG